MGNGRQRNGRWVDVDRGIISREIFVNEDIYRSELEQIFARTWLCVGHESQIPEPGDFFLSRMGEESVIVTRDPQRKDPRSPEHVPSPGHEGVPLRPGQHLGVHLSLITAGATPPTAAWCGRPGDLFGVPQYHAGYREQLDKTEWGLIHVAQMEVYKGTIWATWDESAPSFDGYLGGMRYYLDALLDARDGSEGGSEVLGGMVKWRMQCNWKLAAENFAWDTYHSPTTHKSAELAGMGPGGEGQERHGSVHKNQARRFTSGLMAFPSLGHASITGPPEVGAEPWFPEFP